MSVYSFIGTQLLSFIFILSMAAFTLQAELSSDTDYMVMNLKYLLLGPLQEKKKKKSFADSWIRYYFIGPLGSSNIGCSNTLVSRP